MQCIIADIGSNFTTLQEAYISIEQAALSGARVAKFQLFSEHDLYGDGSTERNLGNGAWLPLLRECCDQNRVEFGCTAFSVEGHKMVDPYVQFYKVASSCVGHLDLLEAIAKSTSTPYEYGSAKKHVVLSVGASTEAEIRKALHTLSGRKKVLMYCQTAYPSRMFDPEYLKILHRTFPYYDIGYSDHTTDIYGAPLVASRMSFVTCLEKHFTAFPLMQSPDRPHSLTPQEFSQMVQAIYSDRPRVLGPSPEEAEFERYCKVRHNGTGYYRTRR